MLLSAGVDYPEYKKQVEMAMKAGASGVLGGRAFWKEYFTYPTPGRPAEVRRERVRQPRQGDRRDREERHALVRQVRPDDGRSCTTLAPPRAGTSATAAAPASSGGAGQVDPNAVY